MHFGPMEAFSIILIRAKGLHLKFHVSGKGGQDMEVSHLINLEKSELIPIRVIANVEDLDRVLGCRVGSLPTKYLGLLLQASFRSSPVYYEVEERFYKRPPM
ncbi:hypothetical protein CK203_081184 [Vitis vinifera]|uniref:Uncharacterized protein n=1 Tax=Vitis vinifera TaxID=29760 RepID=A0A438ERJ2_VITVI|nr:hypothetical protein CK203_081184 [Vitis vinifera]